MGNYAEHIALESAGFGTFKRSRTILETAGDDQFLAIYTARALALFSLALPLGMRGLNDAWINRRSDFTGTLITTAGTFADIALVAGLTSTGIVHGIPEGLFIKMALINPASHAMADAIRCGVDYIKAGRLRPPTALA